MTLKQKILLLGAIPVLLMALVVNLSNYLVARSDLESELVVARDKAVKERKALLSSYLMLAKTAIDKVYAEPDSPEARARVKEILRPLRYGSDGYFFVYDFQGNTLLLPTRPEVEGKNRWQDKDTKGTFLIQEIVKAAREGDGYSEYWTNKPSIGRDAPKLSFNLVLDKYQWVVGTGFYIDDIDTELAALRSEREENMHGSLQSSVLLILVILGVTLAVTVVLGNRVTRPLADAVAALNDIADGEGDLTRRLKVQSEDEDPLIPHSAWGVLKIDVEDMSASKLGDNFYKPVYQEAIDANTPIVDPAPNKLVVPAATAATAAGATSAAKPIPAPTMLSETETFYNSQIEKAVKAGDIDKAMQLVSEAERAGSTKAKSVFIDAVKRSQKN